MLVWINFKNKRADRNVACLQKSTIQFHLEEVTCVAGVIEGAAMEGGGDCDTD